MFKTNPEKPSMSKLINLPQQIYCKCSNRKYPNISPVNFKIQNTGSRKISNMRDSINLKYQYFSSSFSKKGSMFLQKRKKEKKICKGSIHRHRRRGFKEAQSNLINVD